MSTSFLGFWISAIFVCFLFVFSIWLFLKSKKPEVTTKKTFYSPGVITIILLSVALLGFIIGEMIFAGNPKLVYVPQKDTVYQVLSDHFAINQTNQGVVLQSMEHDAIHDLWITAGEPSIYLIKGKFTNTTGNRVIGVLEKDSLGFETIILKPHPIPPEIPKDVQ